MIVSSHEINQANSMYRAIILLVLSQFSVFVSPCPSTATESTRQKFQDCISAYLHINETSNTVFTSNSPDYSTTLSAYTRIRRFHNTTPTPEFILAASNVSHIQGAIICAKKTGLQLRIRSGGHDYEGLSFVSDVPFIVLDLFRLRAVTVDIQTESAWVQAGATLGDLYRGIGEKSKVHGFPAGSCSTVGVGGQFGGGGLGFMMRKHGLSADNVLDAVVVNADGRILTRETMGEDLFWAIRGGGAASFAVVVSWKVRLVPVPENVSVCNVRYTLEQGAGRLFQKWQRVAHTLDDELFLHVVIGSVKSSTSSLGFNRTARIAFQSLYLGGIDSVLSLFGEKFPELNVTRGNCTELSWIQVVLRFAGYATNSSLSVLSNRDPEVFHFSKMKSDYVTEPISEAGLEGFFKLVVEKTPWIIFTPHGGRMSEIAESDTPFPHRNGTLYGIQYGVDWFDESKENETLRWMDRIYEYMEPYVSREPRRAYVSYRDLDLGTNGFNGSANYEVASVWGRKYYKNNFERLVRVKTAVDPDNFFRNEQSIPVVPALREAP
nr:PREDICTED: flavin-dependent oxidoreductase FOX2-like isoform X1 [Bemisia tabaci]